MGKGDKESIEIDGLVYFYEHKAARNGDICLGTKEPKRYCNGFYTFSSKVEGNGLAFVVSNPPTKEYFDKMYERKNDFNNMEKRQLQINELAQLIDNAFVHAYYYDEPYQGESEYYPYRIYPDGTMMATRSMDKSFWKLSWVVGLDGLVTFSEKSEWEKVEEQYIPTGEIGARSAAPFAKTQTRGRQERYFPKLEARMTEDGNGMEGLGIITNSRTLLFTDNQGRSIYEEIAPSAVADYDLTKGDIISAFNHNFEKILGRTSANTLAVTKDANGMRYSIPSLPNTSYGNDLKEQLSRGDVKGSSFFFTIAEESWTEVEGGMLRTINQFEEIYEVGPVVFPAYLDTTAAKRSLENLKVTELEIKEVPKVVDFSTFELKRMARKSRLRHIEF